VFFVVRNDQAERRVSDLIQQVKGEIEDYFGDQTEVILLIGGLARGEGAWKRVDGQLKVLSDLDVLVGTKSRARHPNELGARLDEIGREVGIPVDLRIRCTAEWKLAPRDTELFDIAEWGVPICGTKEQLGLPRIEKPRFDFKNSVYLFFNRAFLTIEECSPGDFVPFDENALSRLSKAASQTMFTCADFITIHCRNYFSSVLDRVRFVNTMLPVLDLNIDVEEFLADLNRALDFKFRQVDNLFLEDAQDFWRRARGHLVGIFSLLLKQECGVSEVTNYEDAIRNRLSVIRRTHFTLSRLRRVLLMVKKGRIPSIRNLPNPQHYCRLAGFMLYMALGDELSMHYVRRAQCYLARVYWRKSVPPRARDLWLALRDDIHSLRNIGVT